MYLGVDIGGTKTLLGVFTEKGKLVETMRFKTPKAYHTFLSVFRATFEALGTHDITYAAVAAPGKIDRSAGVVDAYGNLAWKETPLRKDIEHIINAPVLIENDANLAGLSEANLIKKDFKRVLYVTISTGIGTGIITSGIIDAEFADSEGGHMMLEHNDKLIAWEDFASGRAIKKRFGKQASDINDKKTWTTVTRDIARGILNLVAITQPDVIVIGGGVGTHFDKFDDLLKEQLKKYETPLTPTPPLRRAKMPEEAVLYGCYELIRQEKHG
jgi:glucokinase